MTESRFNYLLDSAPGIGVRATTSSGSEVLYFYEDFTDPGDGINRAMSQLYPQMDRGIFTKIVFVERPRR